jgi:hypothetical protein
MGLTAHLGYGPYRVPLPLLGQPGNSNREVPRCWRPVAGDSSVCYGMHDTRLICRKQGHTQRHGINCGLELGCSSGRLHVCARRGRSFYYVSPKDRCEQLAVR